MRVHEGNDSKVARCYADASLLAMPYRQGNQTLNRMIIRPLA